MHKTQRLGVQGLPGQEGKCIVDKRFVGTIGSAAQYLVSPIHGIIKKRVANVPHMCPNLMRPASFQFALYQCHMVQRLQGTEMRYGPFAFRFVIKFDLLYEKLLFSQFQVKKVLFYLLNVEVAAIVLNIKLIELF